ncbi:phage N-6-adenine-methyltransferase [Shewanella sp. YQ_9]|uniref:phage N-6-adenine-methyltransferase n=1 Tax=Shewanella sp. YQ_9 TaxID=3367231 RepID=UPI0034BB76F0
MKGEIDLTGSSYAKRLSELKAKPCHLLKEVGDQWRTPPALFWGVFTKFGPFAWDLFSDGDNAKCPNFYTAEDNALTKDWAKDLNGRKGFANPPYSRGSYEDGQAITGMRNIIDKSMLERDKGAKFAFLIKAATSEVWWPEGADHVCFIRGRISFDLPDWFNPADKKQEASSAGFACAIAVFDKDWHGEPFSYVNRDDLLRDGQVMLDMICAAAKSLRAAGSEAGTVDPIEPDKQWAAPDDRWHSSVTSLVNSILDLHPEFKKRSIRDRLCDEATELRSNKVGYDDAQTKIISLMKEIGTQKTANNAWPVEVKDLVEAALDVEPCEPTDNFYQALCVIANERLWQWEKKEVIDYLVIHLREAA